jgi:hypothetical protein
LSERSIAPDQSQDNGDNGNHQKDVNKATCGKNKKSEQPAYYQDYGNKIKHSW